MDSNVWKGSPVAELNPRLAPSGAFRPGPRVRSMVSPDVHAISTLIHAISKDFVLEPILDTVVSLALQHAGADRALLALSRGGALSIIAEGTRTEDVIRVGPRSGTVDTADLPGQVFRQILRTLEPGTLENGRASCRERV